MAGPDAPPRPEPDSRAGFPGEPMNPIEEFLKEHKIDEVECLVPDMAGIARGKILPANRFLKGMAQQGLRIPEAVFVQTVTGD